MQIGEGRGVDNGLDRGHINVVVDDVDKMIARDVPAPDTNNDKKPTNPTTITLQQHLKTKRKTTIAHIAL